MGNCLINVFILIFQEYKFVVTARDGAPDPRLATATVTVQVLDVEDEVPIFHQSSYEAGVKENVPDYMVIQVTVSPTTLKKTKNEKKVHNILTLYP